MAALVRLNTLAAELVKSLRLAQENKANKEMVTFIDELQLVISELGLDADEMILNLTNVIANAQARKDTLFVADIIEYELIPYITNNGDVRNNLPQEQ